MKNSRVGVVMLGLVFLGAGALRAQRWVQATPQGAELRALGQSPVSPGTLYAISRTGRTFFSNDAGATWVRRGFAKVDAPLGRLLVGARDAETVYGLGGGVQRTRDGGRTWSFVDIANAATYGLAEDPVTGVLYAATSAGLYRSADGESWEVAAFGDQTVTGVGVDPSDGISVLAAVDTPSSEDPRLTDTAIWRSPDRGATWTLSSFGPFVRQFAVPRLAFDPTHPRNVYMYFFVGDGEPDQVFASADGGATWAERTGIRRMLDLAVTGSGVLYAATESGVRRSDDRGVTWTRLAPPDDITVLAATSETAGGLVGVSASGAWNLSDDSLRWAPIDEGMVELGVFSIAVGAVGPSSILAIAGPGDDRPRTDGVFRSVDSGETWTRRASGPSTILAMDPRSPRRLYGIANDFQSDLLLESRNGGGAWETLKLPHRCIPPASSQCESSLSAFAIDPGAPDTVLVAGFGPAVRPDLPAPAFLLRTADDFHTWTALRPLKGVLALAYEPSDSRFLYGLTCRGLYRTESDRVFWRPVGRGLPTSCSATTLTTDPGRRGRLYVGTTAAGVFESSDFGVTFHPLGRGLESAWISALVVDPTGPPRRLYTAVPGRGVFRWSDAEHAWTPLNAGLPITGFLGVLALDAREQTLFAGTLPRGLFRLDL